MGNTSGYLVKWVGKDNLTHKGIVRYSEQRPEFQAVKKALVRVCNSDMTPRLDDKGKEIIGLKAIQLLTKIGFVD